MRNHVIRRKVNLKSISMFFFSIQWWSSLIIPPWKVFHCFLYVRDRGHNGNYFTFRRSATLLLYSKITRIQPMKTDLDQLQCVCNISVFTNCHFSKIASKSFPICLQSQSDRDCLETRYLAQSPWLTNVWGSYTRRLASDTEALIFPSRKAVAVLFL